MLKGGPDWRSLPAGGGYEMIHWRRCESWTDLQPGEHWDQRGKRCVLNVAILQQKDQPQVVVYVPCQHLPNDGSNYACIDKDGVSRPTGSKTPTYSSGWFGKRFEHSSGGWPYEFEMNPWKISEIETDTGFLQRNRPTAQEYSYARVTDPYPTGTIATKSKDQWIVAVPRTDLAGEGDYHITMSATDPVKRGARIVSPWLFEYKTGARSWYATPPAWAAIGLLGAAVAGGIWYKRTR